jgi:putative peptide zinc metalloprotease protein
MFPSSPAQLRARPDIAIVANDGPRGRRYSVKDPVSLEYFQLGEREAFLLDQLQSPRSIGELQRAYEQRFAPEQISQEQVMAFCKSMHDHSLLVPEGPGQASVRDRRVLERSSRAALWRLSPLAIRFPGIDPTWLLDRLRWLGRIAFSRFGAALGLMAMVLVGVALVGRADDLFAELYLLSDLFQPEYASAALLTVIILKTWHELGHALACRRFGGECHEVGLMLLFFLPCLYCDVSDTWMLRERWKRSVVALGGVYFELLLAIVAGALWLILAPGFLKVLCLYLAVAASISTLLVNLNPLMRFDGYYLLSDLWGVPNLYEQSRQALWQPVQAWIAGGGRSAHSFDAPQGLLAAYAIASITQFTLIIAGGLWAVYRLLAANDLRPVGDVLVAVVLLGIVVRLAAGASRVLTAGPVHRRFGATGRGLVVAAFIAAVLWFGSGASIEQSLWSPCRIETTTAMHITAPASGELVQTVAYGAPVARGDAVAVLRDPELELRALELQGEEAEVTARHAGLRAMAQRDPELFSEIAVLETRRLELQRQQATLRDQQNKLTVRSPLSGVVMRGPSRPPKGDEQLDRWTGAPLDAENEGCSLQPGDLICVIDGPGPRQAVVLLDESDSGLAQVGDAVRIALDRAPGNHLTGRVAEIALSTSEDSRSRPVHSADLVAEDSLRRPLEQDRSYRVLVRLDEAPPVAQHGAVGQARIITGDETVRDWVLRWLRRMVITGLGSE